jgi:hypothetical protein
MTTLDPNITGRRPHDRAQRKRKTKKKPLRSKAEFLAKAGGPAPSLSVPEAGAKYLGLGRNASYTAAENGQIPTIEIKIGKRVIKRVPVRAMERLLDKAAD